MEGQRVPLQQWIQEIFAHHEGSLLRYSLRFTADLEEARDVVQDAFLRLCAQGTRELTELYQEDRVLPWLFTVCRNRSLDLQRKEKGMRALSKHRSAPPPNNEAGPFQQIERQEHIHQVMQLVETLPDRQQEVVFLKFQNGLSYKEISQITGLTVSHVGVLLHTALKNVRHQWKSLHRAG